MTEAQAATLFAPGSTDLSLPGYSAALRYRDCNAMTGCGGWVYPTDALLETGLSQASPGGGSMDLAVLADGSIYLTLDETFSGGGGYETFAADVTGGPMGEVMPHFPFVLNDTAGTGLQGFTMSGTLTEQCFFASMTFSAQASSPQSWVEGLLVYYGSL